MSSTTTSPPALGDTPVWAGDLEALMEAYRQAGGDPEALRQAMRGPTPVSSSRMSDLIVRIFMIARAGEMG